MTPGPPHPTVVPGTWSVGLWAGEVITCTLNKSLPEFNSESRMLVVRCDQEMLMCMGLVPSIMPSCCTAVLITAVLLWLLLAW